MPPSFPLVISIIDCAAVLAAWVGAIWALFQVPGGLFYLQGIERLCTLDPPFLLMVVVLLGERLKVRGDTGYDTLAALMGRTAIPCLVAGVLSCVVSLTGSDPREDLPLLVIFLLFSWVLLVARRVAVLAYLRREQKKARFTTRLLIVGTGDEARRVACLCDERPGAGVEVAGFLTDKDNRAGAQAEGYTVIGPEAELPSLLKRHDVDAFFVENGEDEGLLYTRQRGGGWNLPGVERLVGLLFSKKKERI